MSLIATVLTKSAVDGADCADADAANMAMPIAANARFIFNSCSRFLMLFALSPPLTSYYAPVTMLARTELRRPKSTFIAILVLRADRREALSINVCAWGRVPRPCHRAQAAAVTFLAMNCMSLAYPPRDAGVGAPQCPLHRAHPTW